MADVTGGLSSMADESGAEKDDDEREPEFVELDPMKRYGRYDEVLGKGAFKTVYRAFDEVDGIEVAWNQVKVQELVHSSEDLDRLYSEVHLLKTLKHKNIIKFYSSWVDPKTKNVNFITEIFTSGTLRQYRKKHKHCDLKAVKNWARQILRGLLYLHSHDPPIIHRDLKCDNIFVNGNQGEVKIGDLGLAAILRKANAAHSVIGTPEFMAPELYEEEYNELVDIYSFGMCLLEMITFEYPYSECSNAAQIYKKVISGKKPAALEKVRDPDVRAFVETCLAAASNRLPARELLKHPFLNDEAGSDMIRVMSKAEDLDSMSNHHDIKAIPQSACNSGSETSAKSKYSTAETEHVPERAAVDSELDRFLLLDEDDISSHRNSERNRSSRDFKVKGKRKSDDNRIYLRLRIVDDAGQVRNIHFPFDTKVDTAFSVASEMVAELDLTDQDVCNIADLIDAEIMILEPDWHPGVAVDDDNRSEADYGSGSGSEFGDYGHEEESAMEEKTAEMAEEEHIDAPGDQNGNGHLLTVEGSTPKQIASPVQTQLSVAQSSVHVGFQDKGFSIGRFWEGSMELHDRVASSADESERDGRISPVPEDDIVDEDFGDAMHRLSRNHSTSMGYHSERGSMDESDGYSVSDDHHGLKAEHSLMYGAHGVEKGLALSHMQERRHSVADMGEFGSRNGFVEHHLLSSRRMEHCHSEDSFAHFEALRGTASKSRSDNSQLTNMNGVRKNAVVEYGTGLGDEDADGCSSEEERQLLIEKKEEMERLEEKYTRMLLEVRNRNHKFRGNEKSSRLTVGSGTSCVTIQYTR